MCQLCLDVISRVTIVSNSVLFRGISEFLFEKIGWSNHEKKKGRKYLYSPIWLLLLKWCGISVWAQKCIVTVKGAQYNCFQYFSFLLRFWYWKKAHISPPPKKNQNHNSLNLVLVDKLMDENPLSIIPGEFYSWKGAVLKIIMKIWLVMVTIIKLTWY